jgi:hypothetical protein
MNKNSFNLRRCWSLLKGDLSSSSLYILLYAGAVFLILLALVFFSVLTPNLAYANIPELSITGAQLAALSAMGNMGTAVLVAQIVIFSRVFANMSTRSGEISYLMLPATNSEKWISRVVYVVLVGAVLTLAVYYLAVLFCGVLGWMFDLESLSLLPKMVFDGSYVASLFHFHLPWQASLVNLSSSFFVVAVFVLGGTWFRRLPWLYTALILLGTLFVIVITGAFGVGYYISQHTDLIQKVKAAAESHNLDAMFSLVKPLFYYTVTAVLTVLSMGCFGFPIASSAVASCSRSASSCSNRKSVNCISHDLHQRKSHIPADGRPPLRRDSRRHLQGRRPHTQRARVCRDARREHQHRREDLRAAGSRGRHLQPSWHGLLREPRCPPADP